MSLAPLSPKLASSELNQRLQQQSEARRALNEVEQQLQALPTPGSPLEEAQASALQAEQAASQTLQVRQALTTLREQAQWLDESPALGETLRAQVSRLPEMPKPQQLDSDMPQLRVQRLHFEDLMDKLPQLAQGAQEDGTPLTAALRRILDAQLANTAQPAQCAADRLRHSDSGAHQAEGGQ